MKNSDQLCKQCAATQTRAACHLWPPSANQAIASRVRASSTARAPLASRLRATWSRLYSRQPTDCSFDVGYTLTGCPLVRRPSRPIFPRCERTPLPYGSSIRGPLGLTFSTAYMCVLVEANLVTFHPLTMHARHTTIVRNDVGCCDNAYAQHKSTDKISSHFRSPENIVCRRRRELGTCHP